MAILRDHRRKIKGPIFQPVLNELLAMPKVCKGTYWKLISTSDLSRNIGNKWSEHLGKQFTNEDMRDFFTLNFQCTKLKVLTTRLLLVLEVWDGKPTYRKSWAGNLLAWLDLTLGPFFKVKRG